RLPPSGTAVTGERRRTIPSFSWDSASETHQPLPCAIPQRASKGSLRLALALRVLPVTIRRENAVKPCLIGVPGRLYLCGRLACGNGHGDKPDATRTDRSSPHAAPLGAVRLHLCLRTPPRGCGRHPAKRVDRGDGIVRAARGRSRLFALG